MSAAQGPSPDFGAIVMLVVLAACLCVVYWRAALRLVAIVIVALTIYGAVLLIEQVHHLAG
jgi:hypothetical protein